MAGKQANGKADEEEGDTTALTPVGDGADARAENTGDDDLKDTGGGEADEDGPAEDRRAGASDEESREDEDEGGGRRPMRARLTRSERNELRRRSKERDRTELRFLRARNEQLEKGQMDLARRLDATEKGQVDARLGQIRAAIQKADATQIKATAAGEEAAALEAASIKNNLTEQLRREEAKFKPPAREESAAAPPKVPEAIVRNVDAWMGRNEWFDPEMGDRDSRIARVLDEELLAEGRDPNDPAYYRELDKRVAKMLPERALPALRGKGRDKDEDRDEDEDRGSDDDRGERKNGAGKGGPTFRVGGRERSLRPNEVYVSEERRKALEEMGAWDDVKVRNRYLKKYKEWDEQNASPSR